MKFFTPKEIPELEKLKLENEELKNKLHKVLADNNESTDLESKISDLTQKLSELAKEEQQIEDFINSATEEKINKSKSVFDLNKQIGELAQKKELLEENITSVEKTNNTLIKKQETYEQNLSELESSIKKKTKEITDLNNKFEKLNNKATKVVKEIKSEEARVGGLIETSTGLASQIKTHESKVAELEKEIERNKILQAKTEVNTESLQETYSVLEKKKTKLLKEISTLESKISKSNDEHASISEKLKKDEEIRSKMQTHIAELMIELNGKEKTFKDFMIKKENHLKEISRSQDELDNINFEIINKNEIIDELEKEIESLNDHKKEILSEIGKKKGTLQKYKRILIKRKNQKISATGHLEELQNNINELEEKKFNIEENIIQLEGSFSEITKKLSDEINESKSRLITIKKLSIEKDRDLNKKEKIFSERNTQLTEYTGMVRLLRKEKDILENQLNELKMNKETLSENIISLKEKESISKASINQYNSEIQDLVSKRESISAELNSLLDSSYKNFSEYNEKNGLLINEILNHEGTVSTLSEKIDALELILGKINEDISKADLEKEERANNISQLVIMEKSFKERVETYKKELERIEEETILENQVPKINIDINKIKIDKTKLGNNN